MDLPGGVTSISTPASGWSSSSPVRLRRLAVGEGLASDHRPRPHLLLDEPQLAAAAREQVLDDVLEVLRRRLEGLLERLTDPAVGLLDQALELRQRRLQVGALGLELLDVLHRLVVLLLGERVHRAELLAAAHQALDPCEQRLALLVGQRVGGGLRLEPEAAGQLAQVALGVRGGVAHLLRRHLGGGNGLAGVLQASLELGLLLRAGLQGGGGLLAGGGPGLELLPEGIAPGRDGLACALERGGRTVGVGGESEVALRSGPQGGQRASALLALAPDALGEPLLGAQVSEQLRAAHGLGSVVGRLAPAADHPLGAADDLLGLGRLAQRGAKRALGGLACRIGLGDRGAVALHRCAGVGLLADGPLGRGHQPVAPAELLEEPLGAAGGRLRQLAGARVEQASRLRDGDGAEAVGKRADGIHNPHAGEQPVRQRRDVPLGTHQLRKKLPAGH